MAAWTEAQVMSFFPPKLFSGTGEGPKTPVSNQPAALDIPSFKDATTLTRWLEYLLVATIAVAAIEFYFLLLQYGLLADFAKGAYAGRWLQAYTDALKSDLRNFVIGMVDICFFPVTFIVFLVWVRRANYNARKLGANDLAFTPRWAIICFFVPIICLYKPYHAIKEIWQASVNPSAWRVQKRGAILPWWWFLCVISGVSEIAGMSLWREVNTKNIPEILRAVDVSMAACLWYIPLAIVELYMVEKIYRMQMKWVKTRQRNDSVHLPEKVGR
jgi:hypothetical protein